MNKDEKRDLECIENRRHCFDDNTLYHWYGGPTPVNLKVAAIMAAVIIGVVIIAAIII